MDIGSPYGQPRILVAMDEDVLYGLVEYKLRKSGYDVVRANEGLQALDLLRTQEFDVLLMDVMLQKLDGFTVLRELRTGGMLPPAATLIVSARGDEQDVLTAFELGAVDYITKPFSLNILVERLRLARRAGNVAGAPLAATPQQPAVPAQATPQWSIEA